MMYPELLWPQALVAEQGVRGHEGHGPAEPFVQTCGEQLGWVPTYPYGQGQPDWLGACAQVSGQDGYGPEDPFVHDGGGGGGHEGSA
jgi:hypothetical protein